MNPLRRISPTSASITSGRPDDSGTIGIRLRQRLIDGLTIRVTHNKWEDGTVFWLPAASVVSEVALNAFLFLYLMWSNYWLT